MGRNSFIRMENVFMCGCFKCCCYLIFFPFPLAFVLDLFSLGFFPLSCFLFFFFCSSLCCSHHCTNYKPCIDILKAVHYHCMIWLCLRGLPLCDLILLILIPFLPLFLFCLVFFYYNTNSSILFNIVPALLLK